jgi:hypothetical protein
MAAVIPEAAEAVSSGTEAVQGASARPRTRRARTRTAGADRQRAQSRALAQTGGQQQTRQKSRSKSRSKTGRGALKARLPGSHSYQPVILAEFVIAIVIVSVSPLAKGGTTEAQAKNSPSPYSVNTLKQLVAIGGVYFVLALLASSRRAGRYAAWFGGLVLIALGLAETITGDLTAVFKVFGPSATSTAPTEATTTPGTTASNAVLPTPTGQPTTTQQFVNFTQPGVATTTEATPGVTVVPGVSAA